MYYLLKLLLLLTFKHKIKEKKNKLKENKLIWATNQLPGFYMVEEMALNELRGGSSTSEIFSVITKFHSLGVF